MTNLTSDWMNRDYHHSDQPIILSFYFYWTQLLVLLDKQKFDALHKRQLSHEN
jgi:hypothetical protein